MGLQQPGPKQTGRCWGSMGAGEREGPNGIQLWFLNQTHLEALLNTGCRAPAQQLLIQEVWGEVL